MSLLESLKESQKGLAVFGKVKCPGHYQLKPGYTGFKMIPNPRTKHMTEYEVQAMNDRYNMKLKMWIFARDKQGNKVQDFNHYYQPEVSKAWAVEHIYDPLNPICVKCRGRCFPEGVGSVNAMSIKRLVNGKNLQISE